jgi:hypothetical protein
MKLIRVTLRHPQLRHDAIEMSGVSLGIVLADVIPTHSGPGFASVLALLGLICSLLSDKATAVAMMVAARAAVAAFALPFRLCIAIAAAVCVDLLSDRGRDAHREPCTRERAAEWRAGLRRGARRLLAWWHSGHDRQRYARTHATETRARLVTRSLLRAWISPRAARRRA